MLVFALAHAIAIAFCVLLLWISAARWNSLLTLWIRGFLLVWVMKEKISEFILYSFFFFQKQQPVDDESTLVLELMVWSSMCYYSSNKVKVEDWWETVDEHAT